jgi:hypothetical protein
VLEPPVTSGFRLANPSPNASPSAVARDYHYLLTDHLGSTDVLVDETRAMRERMSFDAHGSRRTAAGAGRWFELLANYPVTNTTRGYTGHEHVDTAGIVHMNG